MLPATLFAEYKCTGARMLPATLFAEYKCIGDQMYIGFTFLGR